MGGTGVIDNFLGIFTSYIDSGFGLLGGEVAFIATTGVILSAAYALWLYRKVVFGVLDKPSLKGMLDLSLREKTLLVPLAVLTPIEPVDPAQDQAAVDTLRETLERDIAAELGQELSQALRGRVPVEIDRAAIDRLL